MSGFLVMLKTNLKLVLRNKASIFLIFLIPFAATMILKVQDKEDDMNSASSKMVVQVFDNSSSELSRELINTLKASSSFDITIHQGRTEDINSVKLEAVNIANRSRTNGIVYIPSNFSDSASKGNLENTVTIFTTNRDGRVKLLQSSINAVLSRLSMYAKVAGGSKQVFEQLVKRSEEHKTTGEIVQFSSSDKVLPL